MPAPEHPAAAKGALAVPPVMSLHKRDLVAQLQETAGIVAEMGDCSKRMCSTRIYRCSDLELVCLETLITDAKQRQAAFKRCNKNKQSCTSLFITPMASK